MKKPIKKTYTNDMYLKKIQNKDIRNDAWTQRLFVWTDEQINEEIYTVLTDDYLPPMILGQYVNSPQLVIIDGGNRTGALRKFKFGNYKTTKSFDNPVVKYSRKKRDEKNNIVLDEFGEVIWEDAEFDLRNKTYSDLPEELKQKFNEYQIETVIHEDCDEERIAQLIKRYNNHTPMNTAQKAFTFIDNFAKNIRYIVNMDFIKNNTYYTENDRVKGNLERVIIESIMCMFHLDVWNGQAKKNAKYLNSNATKEQFDKFKSNLERLDKVITDDVKDLFTIKNSFIWFTLFDKFTALNIKDIKFNEFLKSFKDGLKDKVICGESFEMLDVKTGTKSKSLVTAKIEKLEELMYDYFKFNEQDLEDVDVFDFIKNNVKDEVTVDDVEFYCEMLDDLTLDVDNDTKLLEEHNKPSLLATVCYACENDIDLDDWVKDYFKKNDSYVPNQKENYLHMVADLNNFVTQGAIV